jgi:hypothetical protein
MKLFQKTLLHGLRTAFIFIFVATWMYTALPSLFSFPPKVQKAEAAVNFVQGGVQHSTVQTISVASSLTYVGDLLVVVANWDNSLNLSSISDTQGNLYATAIGPIIWDVGNVNRTQLFYAKNIKGGANTVTVALNGTPASGQDLHVVEYSGADTVSPLDATSVGTGTGSTLDSGSVSTSSGNELIFGFGDLDISGTLTAGNGFVPRTQLTGVGAAILSEDKYVTSAGLYNATETGSVGGNWIMMMATFKSNMSGYEASSRSDTLSDSRPSVTSNHTFGFTANHSVMGSSTLTFALPAGFTTNGIDCGDIDAATSSPFNFNYPSCAPTATAWGAQVKAVISNVQYTAGDAGAASTNATAFDSNNIAGDLIVVVVDWNKLSASVSSITDTNGNTYTSAVGPINWNGLAPTYRGQIFYAKNIKGGANTVTVTLSAAATSSFESYIHEYSGADTVSPLDVVSSATSNSGTAMDSGSATTHAANELIFGAGFEASGVIAAGAGFVTRSTFNSNMTEDKSVTSIGAYNATETGGGNAWIMMMATFKATGSGSVLTLTAPLDSAVHVATSTPISIYIGSNATTTQQGVHWITNPSTAGAYTITLGGTSGNSGNFLVAIGGGQTVAATVAESLALTIAPPAFPTTGILDNFNRAQEVPLGNGTWTCPLKSGDNNLEVDSSNQLEAISSPGSCYWSANTFGPDTEAYLNVVTKPVGTDCIALVARISGAGGSISGYQGKFCNSAGTDTWDLYRYDSGVTTQIGTGGTTELTNGDSMGLEVIGNSIKLYHKPAAGAWTVRASATDSTYTSSGRIGVRMDHIGIVADDFGGGTMNGCPADDGASVNQIATTASSVPFGTVSANSFYQGCQDLIISTNAGGGYSLTGQESSALLTSNGTSIPDTRCDAGTCTESAAAAWATASNNGFGHTCANQGGVHDCAAAYSAGVNFKQFANIAGGEAAQAIMTSSTPAAATGRVKYRLSRSAGQSAGTYTNIVDYILTGTF